LPSAETAGYTSYFRSKYGFQFAVTMLIERVLAKRQKRRVVLRINRAR
jgi:hypothetical protein